jgi:hypothetical protein
VIGRLCAKQQRMGSRETRLYVKAGIDIPLR